MPAPCTSHLVTSYIAELQRYTPVLPYLYRSDSFSITGDKVLHSTVTDACTNNLGTGSAGHLIFDLSLLSCQWLEKQNSALFLSGEERQCSILMVSSSNSPLRSAQYLHTPQQKSIQRVKNSSWGLMCSYIHCSTIHNSQDIEATQVSTGRWMDKEGVVHTYSGILLSHKKEWNNTNCNNKDGPRGYYTKWNKKSDGERQNTVWCHLYV